MYTSLMRLTSLFLIAIFVFIGIAGYYLYTLRASPDSTNPAPGPEASYLPGESPQPATNIPKDWVPFTSEKYEYTIKHPADMQKDTGPEGDRFFKHGPTQSLGTELYDGIILMVKSGPLEGKTIEQLAQTKHQELKNAETTQSVSDIITKSYGPNTAYQFHLTSIGDGDYIYLQKSPTEYLEVINMTVEPAQREPAFQQTAETMISSLEF